MAKERLDVLLVERELADTREKAKRLIMAGLVFSNSERMDKPGVKIDVDTPLSVKGRLKYVSRGGLKLERALKEFDTTVNDKVMVDVGSSTGGFTDCALQNGARFVYAIDVGSNQLAWKIRSDERVSVHEKTNFRYVTEELFEKGLPNYATIDVSFISLRLILPVLKTLLVNNSEVIALIKPQFEAERDQVGKKGIIRDKKVHQSVLQEVLSFAKEEGFQLLALDHSPITGGEGNIEFLAQFGWKTDKANIDHSNDYIKDIVTKAHDAFKNSKGDKIE